MAIEAAIAVGIDAASGEGGFCMASLDREQRVLRLVEGEVEQILDYLGDQPAAFVGINAPARTNMGVIRRQRRQGGQARARGTEIREAEYDLHLRGIAVAATPSREALCPAWVQQGFILYRRLARLGYEPFPAPEKARQWLEVHPEAAFSGLLGRLPLPKPALEGRLQRALVLFEHGVRLEDPMEFLEEITRHRLLLGSLPTEMIPRPSQLDALVAAFTAWVALTRPRDLTRVGNQQEGHIVLPVPELMNRY
jgi:hypothetical protein